MSLGSNRFALGVLVVLHVLLALAYAFATPYLTQGRYFSMGGRVIPDIGAPDEKAHVAYVQQLLDSKGFPVLDPRDPHLGDHYESHQPPLYYVLEAGWAKVLGFSDVGSRAAGLAMRALNALIGASGVVGVFFLGYWGFGRRDVGLAAAAFAALLPMNLALSGAVSNDPLLFSLCTWSLAATALVLRNGWSWKRAIALGVLIGCALLTRTTALALVPAVLVGAPFAKQHSLRHVALVGAIAFVLVLPWWIRDQMLYGDPLAMKAFNQAFVGSPTRETLHATWPAYIGAVLQITWRSFIGIFGYMDIPLDDSFYYPAGIVLAILAIGGLLALRKPEFGDAKGTNAMNGAFLLVVLVLFALFNIKYFQAQARYIYPAIGPISIGFGLGILYFAKEKWKTSFIAWTAILTAVNLYVVAYFLKDQFAIRMLS